MQHKKLRGEIQERSDAVIGGEMEKDVESKLKIQDESANHGVTDAPKPKSFKCRAPQENFTIQDFEMGKIYGVGSYSKI
ncbi:hypothetical protein E3N88_40206 [Mikania micrantha]|uniref:Uncharacterized protein n=1 Tax=Mikania micrantha TaxID=192012 RepID=A0A5N6LM17_9ASTR|nr:hypothetical protein E3N88_40206 [Mikania micrantha]